MSQIYNDGTYLENNPSWHEEDSPWKARQIVKIIEKNSLHPENICEVGCGAGGVLKELSVLLGNSINFSGFEISQQAYDMCHKKTQSNLTFKLADLFEEETGHFDIAMAIDVFEHVEDYFNFLRKLRPKAEYKIFHIPLELSAQSILRSSPIIKNRKRLGHIHYFTKDTAIESLRDTGYEIVDYFYTGARTELPAKGWKASLLRMPRKLLYAIHKELAVRLLGGYSLLVLAK